MFENEVNKLFALSFRIIVSHYRFALSFRIIVSHYGSAILAPAEKDLLITTSRAASVLTPLPPVPGPRISTQALRNSSQSQRIFTAWTSRHPSLRAPVITSRWPL